MNAKYRQSLSELADVNPRVNISELDDRAMVSFIPMSDVTESGDWHVRQERTLESVRSGYTAFCDNDILFAKITPCMENGKGAHVSGLTNGVGFGSTEFHVLRAKPGHSSRFLFHVLQDPALRIRAIAFMGGSAGQQRVQADFFNHYQVPVISPEQQHLVAAILDRLDADIAQTKAIISKLRQVRTGLLHDLLTLGLDENGELRDPIANPNQFKESSLGKIPREWNTCSIEELLASTPNPLRSGPFGSALLKSELKPEGIPFLGIDNVHIELFKRIFTRFVGEEKYQELKRYVVRPNDIMITVMGTVGRCCVVPDDIGRALSSKHVWTVSLDLARYSPLLACWQINHAPWVIRQLRRDEQGGVMKAIRSDTLKALTLPVPDREELSAIESILKNSMAKIAQEECELDKLRLIKSGLMSDFLTGRVQVPSDLLEIVA